MANELNRRTFMKAAALAAGPAIISAQGQNNKINVGWIGVGTRGRYGIQWLHDAAPNDVAVPAICDTCGPYLTGAPSINVKGGIVTTQQYWGTAPKTYSDYRELLADKSIDAVFIMTPEHLRKDMAVAALGAGKHVYLEKPIAHTIEEGQAVIEAWQKSGKICQIGTQNRSSGLYKKAKEWIDQGMIGEVHYARSFWYRNRLMVNNSPAPAWRYNIPAEANPQNTDWNRFLGTAPKRAWDPHRYFQWRLYWDYSNGIATDLMVHQTDIINFMCGKSTPNSVMAAGGVYRYTQDDDRDAADTFSALFEYPRRCE